MSAEYTVEEAADEQENEIEALKVYP